MTKEQSDAEVDPQREHQREHRKADKVIFEMQVFAGSPEDMSKTMSVCYSDRK